MKYEIKDLSLGSMNILMRYLSERENLFSHWKHRNDGSRIQDYCVLGIPLGYMKLNSNIDNGKTTYDLEFNIPQNLLKSMQNYCDRFILLRDC